MAPVQLECPMGSATCAFKTQEVESELALKLLDRHTSLVHPHQVQTPTTSQVKTGKIVRPRLELKESFSSNLGRTIFPVLTCEVFGAWTCCGCTKLVCLSNSCSAKSVSTSCVLNAQVADPMGHSSCTGAMANSSVSLRTSRSQASSLLLEMS